MVLLNLTWHREILPLPTITFDLQSKSLVGYPAVHLLYAFLVKDIKNYLVRNLFLVILQTSSLQVF